MLYLSGFSDFSGSQQTYDIIKNGFDKQLNLFKELVLITMNRLEKIAKEVWENLGAATTQKDHPWRYTSLSTLAKNQPESRLIVLRQIDNSQRNLIFYTHYLSSKIAQIQSNPRGCCLFWDEKRAVQLRLKGNIVIHFEDDTSARHWVKIPPYRRFEYTRSSPPGSKLSASNEEKDLRESPSFFAVLQFYCEEMDWLKLGRTEHLRAQFQWKEEWQGEWVMP